MAEAPERLFVQLTPMGGTISYLSSPPDNRKPVYEYIRVDLPRATADTEKAAQLADDFARRLRSINNHATAAGVEVLAKEIRELTPRATGETTVETALAELREMFPGKVIMVRREDSFYPPDGRDAAETNSMVTIKIGYLESEPKFRSFRSLEDCMAQVRKWKESQ
jgi:hypothetical protein